MLFLSGLYTAAHAAQVPLIQRDDLRRLQLLRDASLMLIDVRPSRDFLKSHIQGARSIQPPLVIANLPRSAHVVVYCSEPSCPLAASAADALAANGYPNVSLLDGGFAAWVAKGYPVQSGPGTPEPATTQLSAHDAQATLAAGAIALDVRPPKEFSAGHLPGARNAPLESLERGQGFLPRGTRVLVYDRLTTRMNRAARKLAAAGVDVSQLNGGLSTWTSQGLPIEIK